MVANHLSPELDVLARQVKAAGKKLSEESEQQDFIAAHDRLTALAAELEMWRNQAQKGAVYWLESYQSRRGMPRLTLSAAPVDIGPAMREQLFDKVPTVILTSATLSVGKQGSLRLFQIARRSHAVRRNPSRQPIQLPRAGRARHASRHARPNHVGSRRL